MNNRHQALLTFGFLILFCCASLAEMTPAPQPDSATGIEGTISIGPIHGGPSRIGVPDSRPLANVAFAVDNANATVTTFTTDDQGRFRISLAPGHYTISRKEGKSRIGHCGPFKVDVVQGKMIQMQWKCDTGMR